jgi:hypothetical protein
LNVRCADGPEPVAPANYGTRVADGKKSPLLTKGTSSFTPVFSSRLAPSFARYVDLKRVLERRFDLPDCTL